MSYLEAVEVVAYHQNMMSDVDQFTPEYMDDLQDQFSKGSHIRLAEALNIVLKGVNTEGLQLYKAS